MSIPLPPGRPEGAAAEPERDRAAAPGIVTAPMPCNALAGRAEGQAGLPRGIALQDLANLNVDLARRQPAPRATALTITRVPRAAIGCPRLSMRERVALAGAWTPTDLPLPPQ